MNLPTRCDSNAWRKVLVLGLICALLGASCAGPGLEPPGANDDNFPTGGRDITDAGTAAEGGGGSKSPPQANDGGDFVDDEDAGVEP